MEPLLYWPVAVICTFAPLGRVELLGVIVIEVKITLAVDVTLEIPEMDPNVAVIEVVPAFRVVTAPWVTFATEGLDDAQTAVWVMSTWEPSL